MSASRGPDNQWNADQYAKTVVVTNLVDLLLESNREKFKPGDKILDSGCGEGFATQKLTEVAQGIEVTAVDYSQSMVDSLIGKNIPGVVAVVRADAGNLPVSEEGPIKPGFFDAVWSLSAWHWVQNHKGLVSGAAQVLKPGGQIVAEFAYQSPAEVKAAIEAVVGAERNADIPGITEVIGSDPWQKTTELQWREELQNNGFTKIEITQHERIQPLKGETGMQDWLKMFAIPFFMPLGEQREQVLGQVEAELKKEKYGLYNPRKSEDPWVVKYNRFSLNAEKSHKIGC